MKNTYQVNDKNADLLAYMIEGLGRIHASVRAQRYAAGEISYAEEIGTAEDRLFRAFAMVGLRLVTILDAGLDKCTLLDGVWCYDHMDVADKNHAECMSLTAFFWRWMDANRHYWIYSAEDMREELIPLEDCLREWCTAVKFELEIPAAA